MARFEEYANKYKPIQMERRDGILRMRLPTMAARCTGVRLRSRDARRGSMEWKCILQERMIVVLPNLPTAER